MGVGGDDDTVAGSSPSMTTATPDPELVAGRYQIVRWLGSGGMGRVYVALDTELGEHVALKVLRAGLSDDSIERFRREVRLTRRIHHANVARMFDIGEHEGDKFLTMELVDGQPLRGALGRVMAWPRLLEIARQITAGLAAAHDKGVIHRDLKPDNVLIEHATERVVITDFGIARSVDDASVTQVGAVIGTPRYMAPEQLAGEEVDARADVFSLGVMLYELATGERPWHGDNAVTIAVAQSTRAAPVLVAAQVPDGFAALVARCLERDPRRRYGSARDVLDALDAIARGVVPDEIATAPARPSRPSLAPATAPSQPAAVTTLAVLPFACSEGDEYLADGLFEDLIDALSSTAALRVRPAGIVRARREPDPRELGRQLEVEHVVSGSVRRTRSGLRISARLISVTDGFQIWAHRVDAAEAEILDVGEQISRGVATALSTRATVATRPTDPRAVDLYLRARAEMRLFWGSHLHAAANLLDQAYELSPTSAPIAGARAFATTQAWVLESDLVMLPRARLAIEQGLATGHAEAYLASASMKLSLSDPIGAATDLGTALVRAPMLAQAHEMTGKLLVELVAGNEPRHHFETARALDPTRAHIIACECARIDALEGDFTTADRTLAALVADPDRAISQLASVFQARIAGWRGDRIAMANATARFAPRMGNVASRLVEFVSSSVRSGEIDLVRWREFYALFEGPEHPRRSQLMGMQLLLEIALVLDKHELALETLDRAVQIGLIDVIILYKCPLFDRIANDSRFIDLRARVERKATQVLAAFRKATS
ncbi:MAG TPA: serine/threonine-protein kinase [Kofleriaceae bacterium]|nr:serine/threonine-protein kinase [Kofleriaceae bacterium]